MHSSLSHHRCYSFFSCLQSKGLEVILLMNPINVFLFAFLAAARHILCEKQGKINEAYKKLQDGWLGNGDKVPPAEFAKVNLAEAPHGF